MAIQPEQMGPLFTASDCDTYERIISKHLANIKQYPAGILQCLEAGGFTVSITGRKFHSVAFDEAHETCINKDMKSAITHPSQSYIQKTSLFANCRIKVFKNLLHVLFPDKFKELTYHSTITAVTPYTKHCEGSVLEMCFLIDNDKMVSTQSSGRELRNVFNGQVATPEQKTNMLSFPDIGIQSYRQYIREHLQNTF